jgi:hypothetical protein
MEREDEGKRAVETGCRGGQGSPRAVVPSVRHLTILVDIANLVRWVPCHHGMARPQVADGEKGLQIWRVSANILNKQPRTADKGCSSSLGVGRGANISSP